QKLKWDPKKIGGGEVPHLPQVPGTRHLLLSSLLDTACGQPVISPRIVGGQPASEGSWPWQVSILHNYEPVCGGSLISEQWVVSAAHCFFHNLDAAYVTFPLFIHFQTYKLADPSPNMIISDVEEIISHPDYAGYDGSMGDIALMKLKSPVNFTDYILPICLPDASVNFFPGERCWITGWGQILQGESLQAPQTLQELEVPIISRDECNNLYNTTDEMNPIKADMICAGYPEGGKDACQGDSGGPLACKRDAVWTLAGVVSWGDGCAKPNHPGVYTLVPFYADWIQDTMAGNGGLHKTLTMTLLFMSLALNLL
uniref:Peptidase S1 domain-containing protein n=1 Tax=Varanus komodoensis TaxID=61221 RepID=A0A8D2JAP7_VARKO